MTEHPHGIGSPEHWDLYATYGLVMMYLSQLEGRLKHLVAALTGVDPTIAYLLTADLQFWNLIAKCRALIEHTCSEEERLVISAWLNDVDTIRARRNQYVHRAWEGITKGAGTPSGVVVVPAQLTLSARKGQLQFHGEEVTIGELRSFGQEVMDAIAMKGFPDRFSLENIIKITPTQPGKTNPGNRY